MNVNGFLLKRDLVFWTLGFSSTSSALAIVWGGRVLSLFAISIFCAIFILLFDKKVSYKQTIAGKYFLVWTAFSLLSILWGQVYFMGMPKWQEAPYPDLLKIFIYLILYVLLYHSSSRDVYAKLILNGIKIGVIVNLIWGILDAVVFYSLGYSLTNTVFESYIIAQDIRQGSLALVENDSVFRTGGLNGDPSNIGLFAIILAFYALLKKKYLYLVLCLLSVFASISFIALCGMIVAFVFYVVILKNRRIIVPGMAFSFVLIVGFYVIYHSDNAVVHAAKDAFEYKLDKKSNTDGGIRGKFVTNFIPAVLQTPSSLLIGTGYQTASYAYRDGLLDRNNVPYDMENHYISTFFDLGLIGFMYFMLMYFRIYKALKYYIKMVPTDYNYMLMSCIVGALIAFATYHFTIYSLNMIVCFSAICYIQKNNELTIETNGKK